MAGVYILNMKMPESCFQCRFSIKVDPDNLRCIVTQKIFEERFFHMEHRDKSCPLIAGSWFETLTPEAVDLLTCFPSAVNSLAAKLNERIDMRILYGIKKKEGGQ